MMSTSDYCLKEEDGEKEEKETAPAKTAKQRQGLAISSSQWQWLVAYQSAKEGREEESSEEEEKRHTDTHEPHASSETNRRGPPTLHSTAPVLSWLK